MSRRQSTHFCLSHGTWSLLIRAVSLSSLVTGAYAFTQMSEAEKDEIREKLGAHFDDCMKIASHFGFCAVQQSLQARFGGQGPYISDSANYDCSGDVTPAGLISRYGFSGDRAACAAAMTPQPATSGSCGPQDPDTGTALCFGRP